MTTTTTTLTTLILIAGLPGAGKTTLAKCLKNLLPQCLLLEYDDLQQDLTSLEAWKHTRQRALQELQQALGSQKYQFVVMDDNFQLSSMRKQVFHVAQKQQQEQQSHRICLVHLTTSKHICLQRNQQRKHKVREEVIQNMIMEPLGTEPWERGCSLTLSNDPEAPLDVTTMAQHVHAYARNHAKYIPRPVDVNEQHNRLEKERQITKESRKHQIDQLLRKCVQNTVLFDKKLAATANQTRKRLQLDDKLKFQTDEEICTLFLENLNNGILEDWQGLQNHMRDR